MFVRRTDRQKWGLSEGQQPPLPLWLSAPPPLLRTQPFLYDCHACLFENVLSTSKREAECVKASALSLISLKLPFFNVCLINVLPAGQCSTSSTFFCWETSSLLCDHSDKWDKNVLIFFFPPLLLWLYTCSNQFAYKRFHCAAKAITQTNNVLNNSQTSLQLYELPERTCLSLYKCTNWKQANVIKAHAYTHLETK